MYICIYHLSLYIIYVIIKNKDTPLQQSYKMYWRDIIKSINFIQLYIHGVFF